MPDPGISEQGAVEFWVPGDCFDAPLHIPYIFEATTENIINIVNNVNFNERVNVSRSQILGGGGRGGGRS